MYLMLTERCNMKCAHCCYSCTSKGRDMSYKIFEAALKLDSFISLGGGEPTLHPDFWKFLGRALEADCESIWLATNGSQTKMTLALAKLAKAGVVGVALSLDQWHDPIDRKVIKAFEDAKERVFAGFPGHDDLREVREVQEDRLCWTGRAKQNFNRTSGPSCSCEDAFVKPNGDIYKCGCLDAPKIGTVFKPFDHEEWTVDGEWLCWREARKVYEPKKAPVRRDNGVPRMRR